MWPLIKGLLFNKWTLGAAGVGGVAHLASNGQSSKWAFDKAGDAFDGLWDKLGDIDWGSVFEKMGDFAKGHPGPLIGGALGMVMGRSMMSTAIGAGVGAVASAWLNGSFSAAAAPGAPAPAPQAAPELDNI